MALYFSKHGGILPETKADTSINNDDFGRHIVLDERPDIVDFDYLIGRFTVILRKIADHKPIPLSLRGVEIGKPLQHISPSVKERLLEIRRATFSSQKTELAAALIFQLGICRGWAIRDAEAAEAEKVYKIAIDALREALNANGG